jgi:hypothetical protein
MDLSRFETGYSDCNTDYVWAGWQAAQRPWVGLTNKEIAEILCDDRWQMRPELMLLACQAKLKERNT